MDKTSTIYLPRTMAELQSIIKNISNIHAIGGGTEFLRKQYRKNLYFPERIAVLKNIPELKSISKTERTIDFGAAASLQSIVDLGEKNIPQALYEALIYCANPAIRNLATIGGNIAKLRPQSSTLAVLASLDAKIEIRTAAETLWLPIIRFADPKFTDLRSKNHIITKIRISSEPWDYVFYKRIGGTVISKNSASFIFLVRLQKNIIYEMRLIFSNNKFIKNKEFNNLFIGRTVPISERDITVLIEKCTEFFPENTFQNNYLKNCFFNLIEDCLYKLI
ncbi:FAD binding domain-containing protein [Treponema phagedenis]|nr:FAD binding domain-containing protein [Treponema phagedenis]NVP24047.1 FAD binding domain-containing protein [Treponema phagedenis]QKS93347.1 FAD binding domain-containing protein [Treponema phagedenis]QLC59576.1 FAD binding domain-containing protein [Treponema phagedenis]